MPKEVLMPNGFTWKLVLLVLLWGAASALGSCTTARARLMPAERVGVPGDEFPAASPGYVPPASPSQIQAP
jgi:hypothetical protein